MYVSWDDVHKPIKRQFLLDFESLNQLYGLRTRSTFKLVDILPASDSYMCLCAHTYTYLTAFGVFRRPPWKELSCKLQTALAQAQQEHGFCVKHAVCGYKQLFM